jgi:hypothetical protein
VQLLERLADVAGEEGRVPDPVQLRILERAGDRLLRDVHAPDGQRASGHAEADRAGAAVEVVDGLFAGEPGVLDRQLVEPLRHPSVRLQERVRADPEPQAEELLLDRVVAPEEHRRKVRHLRGRLVHGPVDRAHLGESAEHLDEVPALEALALGGHELDEHLSRVATLAHDEVAQVALAGRLVVGG